MSGVQSRKKTRDTMGTLIAVYVRCSDPATAASLLVDQPHAFAESGSTFYAIEKSIEEYQPPVVEMGDLSKRFKTDVIWLAFQSVVDAFEFHHWHNGVYLRGLVYGCYGEERTWDQVRGEAEPWESEAFFQPSELESLLEYVANGTEVEEFKRIWRERIISPGNREPSVDAREAARKVAEFYRLPGWSLTG